jgi:endoglucanase
VDAFAWYSYLRIPKEQQNPEAARLILRRLEAYADALYDRVSRNGYRAALNTGEYYWGSNSVALGYAFDLVQAYEFTGRKRYREAALDQLHYVMGRNPFGLSYVTGTGHNSVQNPYHQFSMKLNHPEPVPGMVVGGPNNHSRLGGRELSEFPAKAYEDRGKNYMVNETAINYTAPFVYLAGYFYDFREPAIEDTF